MSKFSEITTKLVNDKIKRMSENYYDSFVDESDSVNANLWKEQLKASMIGSIVYISTPYDSHFTLPKGMTVDDCKPSDLPKREGLNYITSYKELREGDLILTVDYDYNESVERVKCVDMGIWTESVVDGEELFETREEFAEYRFVILLNRG